MSAPAAIVAPDLPHGALASTVIGMAAAACGWLLLGIGPSITSSYTRLDQFAALVVGAAVGGSVIAARAFRQRGDVRLNAAAGALLGGVGALIGVSLLAFIHAPTSPGTFLVERVAAWGLSAAGAAALLATLANVRAPRWIAESAGMAFGGGAFAGVIFTLPGAPEVWQAIASLWFGGAIGLAVAGPELWHATATIELLPARGQSTNPLTIREWPLHEGTVLALGEAQVACVGGRIALYPPAGGIVAADRTVRIPAFIATSTMIAVGRTRYHLCVRRVP